MRAIEVARTGGAEVLELVDSAQPEVAPGTLLVEVHAAGVNFIDIYFRRGAYPIPLPFTPGGEGVGLVRRIAPDVSGFEIGDRVAWSGGMGSYAEMAVVPAATTAILPKTVSDDAGFVIAQGLTAHYLAHDICPIGSNTIALVHAAAGGVGSLLTQILKIRGARVIGTVSSPAKFDPARRAGADEVIGYSSGDFAPAVRALTGGEGVDVAFDGVGAPTLQGSLASIRKRGAMVLYGTSGGPVDSVAPISLLQAGSVSFIRPGLADYIATRAAFQARMDDLFTWIENKQLFVDIGGRYPLNQAADAQRALESRGSTGKLILTITPDAEG